MRGKYFFMLLTYVFSVYGSTSCPALNNAFTQCGITNTTTYIPSNTAAACSVPCCSAFQQAETNCSSDSTLAAFVAGLQVWQKFNCQNFICGDACLDPLATLLGSNSGALNKAYLSCGVSTNPSDIDGSKACTPSCCGNMSIALTVCNGSTPYQLFDVTLTAYQLLNCPNVFTCYPNDKCFDPLGILNNGRGAINRALGVCGIPGISQISSSVDFSDLVTNLNSACSNSCCVALENAAWFCQNQTSSSSQYEIVSDVFPAWQALNCPTGFTCRPTECFDPVGLLNSRIGAANNVLRACGAVSDVKDFVSDVSNFDPYRACHLTCCNEIVAARPFCNSSSNAAEFNIFVDLIYAYQATICNATAPYGAPFICRPNDQCWDILGAINSKFGAGNRALAACGAPLSLNTTIQILDNQLSFNLTKACTDTCCDAMTAALPFCNTTDSFNTLNTVLTAYQLLRCPNSGFTCVPNNLCFDPEGLVNADRGYLNMALKACGASLDVKTLLFDPSSFPTNLNDSCGETCCIAVDNAAPFCNNSDAYQVFKDALPLWQAKWCNDSQCQPQSCLEVAGLINSRLGAVNRVLRYCGAPSQVTDLENIVFNDFDKTSACRNSCCFEIDQARSLCQNYTAFSVFLEGLAFYQVENCNPLFLCQPNDQCFDPLGLINPELGALNRAFHECGASTTGISDISDLSSLSSFNTTKSNQSLLCLQSCCTALDDAASYCNSSSTTLFAYRLFSQILFYHQSLDCTSFTCKTDIGCYDSTGVINSKITPLQNAVASCGFIGDVKDFTFNPLVTQLDLSKACTTNCCNQLEAASAPCNGTYLYPLFVAFLQEYQEYHCVPHFQCNITVTNPPFSLLGLSFAASVGVVSGIAVVGIIIVFGALGFLCCHGKSKKEGSHKQAKQ